MGIRGLTGFIQWAAPSAQLTPDWKMWHGKKIGIDILGFLYKTKAHKMSTIEYLANFIIECKNYGITPVMIFDGKPPNEKRETLRQRTELRTTSEQKIVKLANDLTHVPITEVHKSVVDMHLNILAQNATYFTSQERDFVKQFFYACGVVSLNATGEADDALAYLSKNDQLAAIISYDMDLLPRGVNTLIVPQGLPLLSDKTKWIQYDLKKLCECIGFEYNKFVEMCVLMGCDYTAGLTTIPYKSAYWAIKYRGQITQTLESLGVKDNAPYYEAINRLHGTYITKESLMGEKQWEKFKQELKPELEVLNEFKKTSFPKMDDATYSVLHSS